MRRQKASTMLQNSSITQGGLRVASPNGILAQSVAGGGPAVRVTGLQIVDGVLRITGTIDGDGVFEWSGSIDQEGATNLRGPVAITGQSGTLTVDAETLLRGVTKMLADLRVESGGKITAGNVIMEPNKITVGGVDGNSILSDSKLTFANGAELRAPGSGGVRLTYGTTNIFCDGTSAIVTSGTRRVIVTNAGFQFFGVPTKTPAATGLSTGAAHLDASGNLFRVS
ncbi:hypothetical protein HWD99_06065 [Microbacterium sp. C5A9]|uniref:hypothetical protein n=1 Tax=Microbacterium sp. C5A9 TaxID=2736663 RepID=UPI001F528646|nr:hypothetical protein [Microbacterium sp. C5A9]MCI1018184.1 hypothetical protein [Microbacterium sp. C5A9]